ncbi:Defensin-like (DEFL) family protein [Arabidopsis thaliana]|uniref:Defensin-like (DEFL) family protein n=1 Tax=Arabidopsis thaliana TaxID=3702 RepID=A0A1P8B092_ARATH|nr:Defensin-like (DEFL) family protein [Arabidopsis thaliana]ANM62303.1 Defensin-like (DEFL) family protein [Arabidopsis thaliana]|eukprot:NP_001324468.1 Defensin-like (DEFL) family protein [Arabidopsis thaliana]
MMFEPCQRISNGMRMTQKVSCIEGRTLWARPPKFFYCSSTLCEDNCINTGAYRGGTCDMEDEVAICRCHRCKKII